MGNQKKKSIRTHLITLAVPIIVLLLCFVTFELLLRVTNYRGGEVPVEDFIFIQHKGYNPFLIFGPPINRTVPQENGEMVYWNSQGFRMRGDLPLQKAPDEYRVFALGGSTTVNLANKENLHYPGEATALLADQVFEGKHVNIINSGMSAFSTAHTLVRFQFDIIQFQPDMVTVMHNINDLDVNFFPFKDGRNNYANKYLSAASYHAPRFNLRTALLRKSRVLIFSYKAMKAIVAKLFYEKVSSGGGEQIPTTMRFTDEPIELRAAESFRNNLIALSRIGKAHNITVVFLSQPAIFTDDKIALSFGHKPFNDYILYPPKEDFKTYFEEYNNIIKTVAEEEGVHFIDMYTLFGHDEKDFSDMNHYTPEGIRRFSEIYAKKLKEIIESD